MEKDYLPKYIRVKRFIEKSIKEDNIKPGDKIPAEKELTDRYSVSRHTVRKALDLLEREGVLEKRQGIGTFYKGINNSRQSKNIGFISISLHDYIFADILSGIDSVFHQNGYQIILGNSLDNLDREKAILRQFLEKNIDGLIIEPAKSALSQSNLSLLQEIIKQNIPVVTLDSEYNDSRVNSVVVDDLYGGFLAVSHLLEMGHQEVAIIYKSIHNPALARLEGYKKGLSQAGLILRDELIKGYHFSEIESPQNFKEEIRSITNELLVLSNPPTAIFCFNDQIAVLVKEILNEEGIAVPEDISLVGFDDSLMVNLNNISITSVSHPKKAAGKKAAEIILKQLVNIGVTEKKVFKPELVKRDSVKFIK